MKRLYDLDPAEVSLVPRGANKKKFLIFKNMSGKRTDDVDKGGPGSGPQKGGGGKTKDQRTATRQQALGRSNAAQAKFVRTGNAIRAGQQNARAYRNQTASLNASSRARAAQRMGKSMVTKETQEIRNLINSVDETTMNRVTKVLKAMPAKMCKATDGKESPGDIAKDKMDGGMEAPALSERAQAALKAVARIIAPFKDEISDDHMDAVQGEVGIGGDTQKDMDGGDMGEVEMSAEMAPEGVSNEHHAEALTMAKKSYMDHLQKMGYRKYPDAEMQQKSKEATAKDKDGDADEDEEDQEESVGKTAVEKSAGALDLSAFPKEQRSQLELIFKSNQELVQKNADLEKQLKEERDVRLTKEFQERAKGFTHLGADTEKLATVMKSLAEKDPESLKEIESVLKANNEQMRVAKANGGDLFNEIGTSASGAGGSRRGQSDAEAKLDALVDSVVQKSDGRKTREQIYDEVLRTAQGQRLYAEAMSTRPGGI